MGKKIKNTQPVHISPCTSSTHRMGTHTHRMGTHTHAYNTYVYTNWRICRCFYLYLNLPLNYHVNNSYAIYCITEHFSYHCIPPVDAISAPTQLHHSPTYVPVHLRFRLSFSPSDSRSILLPFSFLLSPVICPVILGPVNGLRRPDDTEYAELVK
jgi:hypothetical protein